MPFKSIEKKRAYQRAWAKSQDEVKKERRLRLAREYKRKQKDKVITKKKEYEEKNKAKLLKQRAKSKYRQRYGEFAECARLCHEIEKEMRNE